MLSPSRCALVAVACIPLGIAASCSRGGLPAADSKAYADTVSAFYVGLAGLQTGEDTRAKEKLTLATQLAPGEPAAWADLALFTARQQDYEKAAQYAETARSLAPGNSAVEALLGAISSKRGKLPEAIDHFRKSVALDGGNIKARQSLATEIERQSTAASDSEAQAELEKILAALPGNVSVQLDIARLAAKRGDAAALRKVVAELDAESKDWPSDARDRVTLFGQTANGPNPRAAAVQAVFLRNVLVRVPAYRQSLDAVRTPAAFIADPFMRFIKLPTPDSKPAAPDVALAFTPADSGAGPAQWASALPLDDSGQVRILEADSTAVKLRDGARLEFAAPGVPGRNSVLAADLNYDFKSDIVLANAAGIRIYLQQTPAQFTDITARAGIPANILKGNYTGAWAFDIDLDGDLDIVLGVAQGEPIVLRNNGDSTFTVIRPFPQIKGLIAFASADLDGDGAADIAMLDGAGALHVLMNQKFGVYRERPLPAGLQHPNVAVASGDVNGDGTPDLVVLGEDGALTRLSPVADKQDWSTEQIAPAGPTRLTPATANLLLADFDNNGSTDILAGDGRVLLGDGKKYSEIKLSPGLQIGAAADLNQDGRLDLIGIAAPGKTVQLLNHGSKNYSWQTVRVRAANGSGDQRINSFGIGGVIEIRSGLLTQMQMIDSPVMHFGLGERQQTDVARIVWPNGSVQAEFELKPNQSILAIQRLKGSCPMLFAWDGKQISFVKDGAPWSPALGLHINAQAVAGIHQTEEWFKVPGEKLVARNGIYDLRVTAELWETFYIDHYSLKVVDHPEGTEIFTDERFAADAPPLKIFTVAEPQPFASATDDRGKDVSEIVRHADATYLDTFGRGRYQGVTRDHWVELELPASAPSTGSLYLLGSGWMHPTDATVNIALSQNSDPPPQGLSIEVPDAAGHWVVKKSGLGFLAGKGKTMVIDLSQIFVPGAPRKLRLRTNLEIYWDQLAWAPGVADSTTVVAPAPLRKADLLYRGFSIMKAANASSPETPDYNGLEGTSQKWRDLEGYYTRHGDVRELIEKVDDRITIMNAGDELRLEFEALAAPPRGWKRDFVMVGDGWIKDGDYNTVFSNTVLPLPYHAMKNYDQAPVTLEEDRAYRLHPADWQNFHTRYITSEWFRRALWN
jgi:Tfp pilus assembly protein PilF